MSVYISKEHQDIYLDHLKQTGRQAQSAEKIGLMCSTVSAFAKQDASFRDRMKHAQDLYNESLEEEFERRGRDGYEEPVFDKDGNHVGDKMRYSDRLLIELTKKHIPEYRDKAAADLSVSGGVLVISTAGQTSPEDWADAQNESISFEDGEDATGNVGDSPGSDEGEPGAGEVGESGESGDGERADS